MNVAFVLGTSTGGTARHVRMLAAGCAARGLPVQVFGPAQTDRDFGLPNFAPVEIADRPSLLRDLRAIAVLRRLIGTGRPEVVHAHGLRAGAVTAIALALIRAHLPAARHRAAPPTLIVTVHNAPPAAGLAAAVYRVLELIVARSAGSVLCVSADTEDRMRAAGARRVGRAVVPAPFAGMTAPGVPAGAPAAPGAGPHRPVVLAAGRLTGQKGFGVLLEAAALWGDIQPAPRLVIAGDGPLAAELRRQAASLGVSAEFAGPRPDMPALLARADAFVLPSAWEGQPLVLQEALRAGVPIVATRVGGIPELTGEDAALLVPPGDPGRLAGAVCAVLTDPALAARLRKAAACRARALPTEDDAVAAVLAEYRRAAPRRQ